MTKYKTHIILVVLLSSFIYVSQTFPFVSTMIVEPQELPKEPLPPTSPFLQSKELECLSKNAYFEAQNQSRTAQIAVMQVVLNRVSDAQFPKTICEVVQQGPTRIGSKGQVVPIRGKCHFSWYCDGKSDDPTNEKIYREIQSLAYDVVSHINVDVTENSLYYHSTRSYPYWRNTFEKTIVIDDHIFYR